MTVEDEKGYEIAEKYLRKKYGDDYVDFLESEGQSYLDGFTEGRKKEADLIFESWCKGSDDEPCECRFLKKLEKENEQLKKRCSNYEMLLKHFVKDEELSYMNCEPRSRLELLDEIDKLKKLVK